MRQPNRTFNLRALCNLILVLVGPALTAAVPAALASDGVFEISQTCATQTGCFPGDGPGFPISITRTGSYQLTGNLDLTAPSRVNTVAIEIFDNGVTIDLNGFSILGATTCTIGSCSGSGAGVGINGNAGGNHQETTVRNGVIRGMSGNAILCDRGCTVESVRIESNGGSGIVLSNGPGVMRRNVIRNNGSDGIFAIGVITENVVERNGGTGIFDRGHSTVSTNYINGNIGNGLRCNRCLAVDNAIRANGGFGATIFGTVAFGRNLIDDNAGGTIDTSSGTLQEVDTNVCNSNTTCP